MSRLFEGPCVGAALERVRDATFELLWPTRCVVCDEPGELLCEGCRADLAWIAQAGACPNCGAPYGRLTCTECDAPKGDPWELEGCVSALPLEGEARSLILAYKDGSERRLAPVLAAIACVAIDEAQHVCDARGRRVDLDLIDAVCFVPATRAAFRRRGFDHMEDIARNLACLLGVPFADVLARPVARDQRSLGKDDRRRNAQGAVQVVGDVSGMGLLLVDDVITTGASMRACAAALLASGARAVWGCSVARTW